MKLLNNLLLTLTFQLPEMMKKVLEGRGETIIRHRHFGKEVPEGYSIQCMYLLSRAGQNTRSTILDVLVLGE